MRSSPARVGIIASAATSRSATPRTRRPRRPSEPSTVCAMPSRATTPRSRRTARSRCWAADRCRSTPAGRRSTPEVEAALKGPPDVFDALVVGVPDARFGNHVAAVVAPAGTTRPTLADLDAFVRKRLRATNAPQPVAGRRGQTLTGRQTRLPLGQEPVASNGPPTTCTPSTRGHQLMKPNCANGSASSTRSSPSRPRRSAAAAVSRAGGMGVLGCVRFNDAEELETTLRWMDENTDGKPYGVDVVMPAKIPPRNEDRHRRADPAGAPDFVAKTLADLGCRPLPTTWCAVKARSGGCTRWPARTSRLRSKHPIKLIANALGSPPTTSSTGPRPESRWPRWPVRLNARRHVDNGVDIVIAQGHEAGGIHR